MARVEEDWCSIDAESKLNQKIDVLQSVVQQQSELIQQLSIEIKQLKQEVLRPPCEHLSSQTSRTHQLLEELKLIKERELNRMLREKIPIPFFSIHSMKNSTVSVPSLPSPLFLAQRNREEKKEFQL